MKNILLFIFSLLNFSLFAQLDPLPLSSSGWSTLGNNGTTAGTNFVGTTDAQDLVFKTNNVQTMKIAQDGKLTLNSIGVTTNTHINGGATQTGGGFNIAVGGGAHQASVTGQTGTSIGFNSMFYSTQDTFCTAIGGGTLQRTGSTGISKNNTGIGYLAGSASYSGSNNTYLGANADNFNSTSTYQNLINVTAIGYNAKVGRDSGFILGNKSVFVGIGTSYPQYKFDIIADTVWGGNPIRLRGLLSSTGIDSLVGYASATAKGVLKRVSVSEISTKSNIANITSAFTIVSQTGTFIVNGTSASYTINLPDPTTNIGVIYKFVRTDATTNTILISTPSGTINGTSTIPLINNYGRASIQSDGVNYYVISN